MKKLLFVALTSLVIGCERKDNTLIYEVKMKDGTKHEILANGYYLNREGFWGCGVAQDYAFYYEGSNAGYFKANEVEGIRIIKVIPNPQKEISLTPSQIR